MSKHDKTESTPVVRTQDLGDVLERWLGELPRLRLWPEIRSTMGAGLDRLKVEEFTDGNQVVVRAELPGIDPDKDVEITVSDHTLRVKAERREDKTTERDSGYRSEFHYGSFLRTVALPVGASDKDVKATYKDGILEVRIPIDRTKAAAERVPVQRV